MLDIQMRHRKEANVQSIMRIFSGVGVSINWANALASALGFYLVFGTLFGLFFVSAGAARLVPAARGAALGFRLMILPGAVMLWPVLLTRLIKGSPVPSPGRTWRGLHARIWVFLVPLVALGVMMSLMLRPADPLNETLPKGVILEDDTS